MLIHLVWLPHSLHDLNVARPGLADWKAMKSQCWTIMGGGKICTDDIAKKKTPFHLYLNKLLPKVKRES